MSDPSIVRRPLGTGQSRSAEMETRILDEAERLFRHYGYMKTTVADIARSLGMSPANVYRFFTSKTQIHEALVNRMLVAREMALQAIADSPCSAPERLRTFVINECQVTVAQLLDDFRVHEMVTIALEDRWPIIDRHIQRMTEILGRIIEDGMRAGDFARGDPMHAARLFRTSTMSAVHPALVAQGRLDPSTVGADQLVDFVIRALKA